MGGFRQCWQKSPLKLKETSPKITHISKTCSSELVISKRLRLSNLSSKQKLGTRRMIFSFNPSLPALLFTFPYESCRSMLFLSPVLLPVHINQAAEQAGARPREVFPWIPWGYRRQITLPSQKVPSAWKQPFEIPITRLGVSEQNPQKNNTTVLCRKSQHWKA